MNHASLDNRIAAIDTLRRHGNITQAQQEIQNLLTDYPDHPLVLNLFALIEHQLGNSSAALALLEQVTIEHPQLSLPVYNLAVIATDCNHFELAEQALTKALPLFSEPEMVWREFERLYLKSQNYISLLKTYVNLLKIGKLKKTDRANFFICMENAPILNYLPELEAEITVYIDDPNRDPEGLRNIIYAQLAAKYNDVLYQLDGGIDAAQLERLAADNFLQRILHELIVCGADLELWLQQVRRSLLSSALSQGEIPDHWLNLVEAIAAQCWLNEYVFGIDEDEQTAITQLISNIETRCAEPITQPADFSTTLLLIAMYSDPNDLTCRDNLLSARESEWPKYSRPMLSRLRAQKKRRELMLQMPRLKPINDLISQKVQAQYEENPYPRWLHCAKLPHKHFADWLKEIIPDYIPTAELSGESFQLLIAGCGTGKQATQIARSFPQATILAVDLSSASLAYAQHKASQHNLKNIKFLQADILDLSQLSQRFDVILCTGVLHHMSAIEPGWQIIRDLLKPNGIMQIALYSRLARQSITEIRNIIAEHDVPATLEGIRAVREMVFAGQLPDLSHSSDFYSTSNCRDLLFHSQEIQSDTADLERMLNSLALNFIGFDLLRIRFDLFKAIRANQSLTTLTHWGKFEEQNPSLFEAMYTFWCDRKSDIASI